MTCDKGPGRHTTPDPGFPPQPGLDDLFTATSTASTGTRPLTRPLSHLPHAFAVLMRELLLNHLRSTVWTSKVKEILTFNVNINLGPSCDLTQSSTMRIINIYIMNFSAKIIRYFAAPFNSGKTSDLTWIKLYT